MDKTKSGEKTSEDITDRFIFRPDGSLELLAKDAPIIYGLFKMTNPIAHGFLYVIETIMEKGIDKMIVRKVDSIEKGQTEFRFPPKFEVYSDDKYISDMLGNMPEEN